MTERASATFTLQGPRSDRARCMACAERVCESLQQVPGVGKVECNPSAGAVVVEYDAERVSEADLIAEVEHFEMTLAESVGHASWRISGLD
ncbi:MAG: heavy-metal-associated domain-containing protein [Coriobacteriales bacterium]|nr:heavy-metal-associated domain-containing protein [Coriobacteriales bacterium]